MRNHPVRYYNNNAMDIARQKYKRLEKILRGMGSTLVALSGGMDSTFLLKMAKEVLGRNVMAVTASSLIRDKKEITNAKRTAARLRVKHVVVSSSELSDDRVLNNDVERCYHCKKILFRRLIQIAKERGMNSVSEGSNLDDSVMFRPGFRAVEELGVRSPLMEAGLSKKEISRLSKEMGLSTWNKPAQSCFLTRFPYGEKISIEKIKKVTEAEEFLLKKGFNGVRVRSYGDLAKIEVSGEQLADFMEALDPKEIVRKFKDLGYNHITLDLEGYRTGSMDRGLVGKKNE